MEFIRKEEPYSGYVIHTIENGKSYRVAPKRPETPNDIAVCDYFAGTGWAPIRDLTESEKTEYKIFIASFE